MNPKILCASLCAALLLSAIPAMARDGAPPMSRLVPVKRASTVPQLVVTPTDPNAELAADGPRPTTPVRFAAATEVAVTPLTHGSWENVAGGRLWRFRVVSAGATDLNFGFSTYRLPQGATLHVYAEDEDYVQGPYDARDNKAHGELWTPVVPGSRATIELFVPGDATEEPQLFLSRVNRGYRDMFHRRKDFDPAKSHGACNIDVICSLGDAWRQEIRSVARYTVNGTGLCTGTLLNTANNSLTNHYFLTAHHCGVTAGSAASLVVYWNYQRPNCSSGNGSLAQNQSGTFFRASRQDVDMTLVELDEIPNPAFRVTYSGWDRSGTVPTGAVGIHHPSGDVKSISASSNTLSTIPGCIAGTGVPNTHWNVVWALGTTEPGSSGSALFNPSNHRVIGFLSGGGASCSTLTSPDCYGKVSVAWDGANPATRLRDWLDPLNSGTNGVSGRDPFATPQIVAAGNALVSENCAPTNGVVDPGESVTISFSLQNTGGTNSGNIVATLLATNGVTSPSAAQNYGVLTNNAAAVTRQFSFVASSNCGATITLTFQIQDGTSNRGNLTFTMRLGTPGGFAQNFDGVTAPALPAGWSNSIILGGSPGWRTVTSDFDTAPNSVLAPDLAVRTDASLYSPPITISSSNATLSFSHWYETEPEFDGGVLEISIDNAAYLDILAAGGSFLSGGYNEAIDSSFGNPLADGRAVWSGNSGNFITTTVNLPASAAGKSVRLRWRLATDDDVEGYGWNVDTVAIADGYTCCQGSPLAPPQIIETRPVNNTLVFSFNTTAGRSYVTEFQNVLNTNLAWTPLQTNAGDGTKKSVTNSASTATNRFFRVRAQ